jgi:hypothetical protein
MDQFCGMHVENFEVEADMVCAQLIHPPPNPFPNVRLVSWGSRQPSHSEAGRNVSSIPGHSRRWYKCNCLFGLSVTAAWAQHAAHM